MNLFYLTFGQQHPLRDAYIEISASTYENAVAVVHEIFGRRYANIYLESSFKRLHFDDGQVGHTLIGR